MQIPPLDPFCADQAPTNSSLTGYNQEHVVHLIVIWPAPGWMTEHDYRYLLCGPAH